MPDPAHEGWKPRTLPGFIGLVGPLWTKKQGASWNYGILAEERHTNPAGIVHGGVLTTLLDHALSAIAWEANERKPCITVALDVHFLAAARPGDLIAAGGRIVRQTSSLVFIQGGLTVERQEIATASAILKVLETDRTPL
jgi:uncharacterized protein (TIGR00369 family)